MPIAELSIKLLAGVLTNVSAALTQINPNTLGHIMKGMSYLIKGKRNNMKKPNPHLYRIEVPLIQLFRKILESSKNN